MKEKSGKKSKKFLGIDFNRMGQIGLCNTFLFWPLIIAGGRLVGRIILNLWNIIEQ